VVSTLGFLGYLVLPMLPGAQPRAQYAPLYAVGAAGVLVAEGYQILGVLVLLGYWFIRSNVQKKPKELVVLLVSLIPYMVVVLVGITLVVYVRARRQSRFSVRTQAAGKALREQVADTLIDAGSNATSSTAGSAPVPGIPAPGVPAVATPAVATQGVPIVGWATMRDAIQQVVGPATGKTVSEAATGLVGVTMGTLLLSTVATVGVAVPSGDSRRYSPTPRTSASPPRRPRSRAPGISQTPPPKSPAFPTRQRRAPRQPEIPQGVRPSR
jgi:hypothetical protein